MRLKKLAGFVYPHDPVSERNFNFGNFEMEYVNLGCNSSCRVGLSRSGSSHRFSPRFFSPRATNDSWLVDERLGGLARLLVTASDQLVLIKFQYYNSIS